MSAGNGNGKEGMIRALIGLLGIAIGVIVTAVALAGDISANRGAIDVGASERVRIEARVSKLENNYERIMDKLEEIRKEVRVHEEG